MTDEPPVVRLTLLGEPDPAAVCADGVCHLPPSAAASGVEQPEVRPGDDEAEERRVVPSVPPV